MPLRTGLTDTRWYSVDIGDTGPEQTNDRPFRHTGPTPGGPVHSREPLRP